MTEVPQSPLSEADPHSLDELFERINQKLISGMPESITDDDLKPVIIALRAQRVKHLQDQATKAAKPPKTRQAKPTSVASAIATIVDFEAE